MQIDDVRVVIENGPLCAEEAKYYIDRIKQSSKFPLKKVIFTRESTYLDLRYSFEGIPFERVRRDDDLLSHADACDIELIDTHFECQFGQVIDQRKLRAGIGIADLVSGLKVLFDHLS